MKRHAWCSALLWMPIATQMIVLHGLDGREIVIVQSQVTVLYGAAPDKPNKRMSEGVNCVIGLTDGRFVSVIESCAEVRILMEEKGP